MKEKRHLFTFLLLVFMSLQLMTGMTPGAQNSAAGSAQDLSDEDVTKMQSQERIILLDSADILSSSQESILLYEEAILASQTGWAVRVCAIDDAEGKDTETWMDDYSDAHYVQEDILGLIIDLDNRAIHVQTGGAARYYIDDGRIENILDDAYGYVSEENYYEAFDTMLSDAAEYYREGIGSDWTIDRDTGEITNYRESRRITQTDILLALVLGIAVGGGFAAVTVGRYRMKIGTYHFDAGENMNLHLTGSSDRLINRFVTQRRISRNPPPDSRGPGDGHGGGSSVHTSSGGHSYGGGSRSF